jgi:hypothetical protein
MLGACTYSWHTVILINHRPHTNTYIDDDKDDDNNRDRDNDHDDDGEDEKHMASTIICTRSGKQGECRKVFDTSHSDEQSLVICADIMSSLLA